MDKKTALINSFNNLLPIEKNVIDTLLTKKEIILDKSIYSLLSREDIDLILNNCPARFIYNNHNIFHAIFFKTLNLNDANILLNHLIWEYKTYNTHGLSYDYFIIRAQIWKAICNEIFNKNKKLQDIFNWFIKNQKIIINLSQNNSSSLQTNHRVEKYYDALILGDHKSCENICDEELEKNNCIKDIYSHIIKIAMYKVGNQWENGYLSVPQEHLACAISTKVVNNLYTKMDRKEAKIGNILVATPKQEKHALGALMVANIIELYGYTVTYLSQSSNEKLILQTIENEKIDIICLSISMASNLISAKQLIDKIKQNEQFNKIKIMMGGYVFTTNPKLSNELNIDAIITDLSQCLEQIDTWLGNK